MSNNYAKALQNDTARDSAIWEELFPKRNYHQRIAFYSVETILNMIRWILMISLVSYEVQSASQYKFLKIENCSIVDEKFATIETCAISTLKANITLSTKQPINKIFVSKKYLANPLSQKLLFDRLIWLCSIWKTRNIGKFSKCLSLIGAA